VLMEALGLRDPLGQHLQLQAQRVQRVSKAVLAQPDQLGMLQQYQDPPVRPAHKVIHLLWLDPRGLQAIKDLLDRRDQLVRHLLSLARRELKDQPALRELKAIRLLLLGRRARPEADPLARLALRVIRLQLQAQRVLKVMQDPLAQPERQAVSRGRPDRREARDQQGLQALLQPLQAQQDRRVYRGMLE
jgi:hypothetical protein